jgi:hypothetical protein
VRSSRRSRPTQRYEQTLAVDDGQVSCPRQGLIDLGRCFQCPHFGGFQEGLTEALVCGYEAVAGFPDFRWGVDAGPQSVHADSE